MTLMRKTLLMMSIMIATLAATVACSDQLGDRGGQEGAPPDHIGDVQWVEVWRNADEMPNVARVCVEGIAFATTSSGLRGEGVASPQLVRVAEWDGFCQSKTTSG